MTSDPAQLIAHIRFALARLSERNAHHEWEHLCRHLTRARICSNILPATGPVQAGGDQGRDFETFHTYLSQSSLSQQSFVGLSSVRPIAFACSLEEQVIPKMYRDVKTIMRGGVAVEKIYLFSSRGVPVAKRHKLLEWAQATYNVSLEVLDGEAIAELLSASDTFWIAVRYLEIPTELYPTPPTMNDRTDDGYTRVLEKWRLAPYAPETFADFTEIQVAARTALGPFAYAEDGRPMSRHERPELPFWIERLDELVEHGTVDMLRRRALYEATVLRLRGLSTLIGQESLLRLYFADIPHLEDVADIEDAETLLAYLFPASRKGLIQLASTEIQTWYEALDSRLKECLHDAEKHAKMNTLCSLLEVRGHLALVRSFERGEVNIEDTFSSWNQLAHLAKRAPLFPLERFAGRLTEFARFYGTHPAYEPLTRVVDELVAERFSNFKIAEMCLSRAKALQKAGNMPLAMVQVHRAKVDWFAEETLGKLLFALLWLSQAYKEQELFFAAKYYALAAAYIALGAKDSRFKQRVARCLESAASCDYATGAWFGFLELTKESLFCHWQWVPEPDANLDDPESVSQRVIFHLSQLLIATKFFYPEGEQFASEQCMHVVDQVGLRDMLDNAKIYSEQQWSKEGQAGVRNAIEQQLAGVPWSDAGTTRRTEWMANGVTWKFQWTNTYEATVAAEDFLAALQVVLSDFANEDLCLMRSTFYVTISLAINDGHAQKSGYKGFDIQFESSNEERHTHITLPPYRQFSDGVLTYDDLRIGALTITSQLLSEVSLLPVQQFQQKLQDRFAHDLANKLHIGASYVRCLCTFVNQEMFEASARNIHTELASRETFVFRFPQALPWRNDSGPGYTTEEACKHIENRYRRFLPPIARTVAYLAREPIFQATIAQLRADGWKDWHLLSAVFHITVNYRMNTRKILLSPEAEEAAYRRLMSQPESENAVPVPLSEYTEVAMRLQMKLYMTSFARTYGLELHQIAPDFSALEDFLASRYHFWSDDIDHIDPFLIS